MTFLFTDIEGSTRLLSELGDRFESLLAEHHRVLRAAIAGHAGTEVSTEGDAFFAVFPSAPEAVAAATEAQRSLAAGESTGNGSVRVRMGLHSGEGRLGGDDYIGLDVHRASRVAAAGHGGQVLLSDATRALVTHDLPDGVTLRDLGTHRLKDLPAPERLWQLDIEGVTGDFPAIRSLDARPNNLPLSVTPLIGREKELEAVSELLAHRRLLTLTGAGGTGKTRLALAAAERVLADLADGAFFVALENARDQASVTAAIAAALNLRERPGRDVEETLRNHVHDRELLLVLDNFEQVLSAAPLVSELLADAPRLRIIVTSRALLHLSAEQAYEVPPLELPDARHLPSLAALSQYEAVALFIERARAVKPDFAVTNENAPAVAEICSRLDGLPLAIELAAARARLLTPQAILSRLERRLLLPGAGSADIPARQRTLHGAIDWSFELLDAPEQRCLERLAVFADGWTLDAAETVCNPGSELGIDTLEGHSTLADNSLIRAAADPDDEPRFEMLQVVREFAEEKLATRPDVDEIRRRHALRMVALAEEAEPELVRSDVRRWQRRLRREQENLRTALQWAVEHGEAEIGLRLAGSLWRFWHYWAQLREGRSSLEAIVGLASDAVAGEAKAKGLSALAGLLYWQGDADRSAALYEEALEIYRRLGDERLTALAMHNTAWAAAARNEIPLAIARAQEAREHYRRAGDQAGVANVTAWLRTGEYLVGAGGSAEDAVAATREAIELNRRAGRAHEAADWMGSLTMVYWTSGDQTRALEAFRDSVRAWYEIGHVGMLAWFKLLAALELAQGRPERAVRLAAIAERSIEELGGELPEAMTRSGDPLEETRTLLSAEEHARGVAEGRAMTFDEAVAYALEGEVP